MGIKPAVTFYSRLNLNAARIGPVAGEFRAFPACLLRKIGLWVFKVYGKIRMKIHHKTLAHLVQFKAKPGAFPIAGICPDPAVPKTVLPSVGNNLKGKLLFGAKDSLGFRDPRFFAALRILGSLLGKVQLDINRDCKTAPGKHPEHRHLAVVDFAETTKPLPGDSDRHRPLLGKAALIYQKTGALLVTQTLVGITSNMIDNTARIPFAVGQKLLEIAGLGIRDNFCHPVHVFTRPRLHETAGVLPRLFRNIVAVGAEMVAEALHNGHKAPADAGERRLRGGIRFSPLGMALSAGCVS